MTRARMIERAEELILDAEEKRARVEATEPGRLPLACAVIDDLVRAHVTLTSTPRLTVRVEAIAASYFTRALLISQALERPVQ